MIASAFTWPTLQTNTCAIQAFRYSGLVFFLTSIAAATQQSLALYRLTSLPDGLAKIREMLSEDDPDASGRFRPRYSQLYIWQAPLLLLNSSVYVFITCVAVLLWSASKLQVYRWEIDETKVSKILLDLLENMSTDDVKDCHCVYFNVRACRIELHDLDSGDL